MPGGAFRPPTIFSLNIPKKTKCFLFPTALPVHITPTAQGQSPSDAGGLFPTAQGQSPSDAGSFFPFPKCPLATTAARCYGTSQLGQCHPRVTLTAGKGWQAPLDPPTGRQGAVPWDRALPRPRPYPGQGRNQPLHPVP